MPTIFIPAPLREFTLGKASVVVSGSSVREAIDLLEAEFPGIKERLCEGDKIRPNISVMVDGQVSHLKMREKLREDSEVHFVIAISGGQLGGLLSDYLRDIHLGGFSLSINLIM